MQFGLIGEKLGHSYSKEIHNLIADYGYELREVKREELGAFMAERDFSGINVTIPYKKSVMDYLDVISDDARKIGAVNTVVNRNGKLYGFNTDFYGLKALLIHNGVSVRNKKVLILGSGGTSDTAYNVVTGLKAKEAIKVSRTKKDVFVTYDEAASHHSDADVIINATPVGMYPDDDGVPVNIGLFPSLSAVIDAIYHPLRTNLVSDAENRGIKACGGLYMLVAQAVYAAALFENKKPDENLIDDVYGKILNDKRNIVLIGMPSSGKTTIGKALAARMGKRFADTDELIVGTTGKSIPEIFEKEGEKVFREIEKKVICDIAVNDGTVIATGGGVILDEKNVLALKRNGVIVYLDRKIDNLIATDSRPLSSNVDDLKKLYDKRKPLYEKYAEITIDDNDDVATVVRRAEEALK
ncbi:MAG: shikimate kinase [Eubacteriales bacterium]|nr:shikimate kinase [Christensenellaceae bacterium]MDY2751499.1 shikimate kinase [Eubacteriales bacterium]